MEPLGPPESHFLSAAIGWIGLGNLAEAEAELGQIGPALQQHPDVLEVRWSLLAQQQKWDEAVQVARWLLHAAPERPTGWIHQAYALRRATHGGLDQAWAVLLPAFDKFPKESIIAYNLACYACQMGRLDDARTWLKRAFALAHKDEIRRQALADLDLQPLWAELRGREE